MVYKGHIKNGIVAIDEPASLPEGAAVEVSVIEDEDEVRSLREILLKYAGAIEDGPSDLAENHDHYIHGAPKR